MRTLDPQEYEILQLVAQHRCGHVIRAVADDEVPILQRFLLEGRITVCGCSADRYRPSITSRGREALRLYAAVAALEAA